MEASQRCSAGSRCNCAGAARAYFGLPFFGRLGLSLSGASETTLPGAAGVDLMQWWNASVLSRLHTAILNRRGFGI